MSMLYTIEEKEITDIADAIRNKLNSEETMTIAEMPEKINSIEGGVEIDNEYNYIEHGTNKIYDESVTSLRSYAFYRCDTLLEISFPECGSIGSSAFTYCTNLKEVNFPKCNIVNNDAFAFCSRIINAYFPECISIGYQAFNYCNRLKEIYASKCIEIGSSAFNRCYFLSEVQFPKCTEVGSNAFYGCNQLKNVYLPKCSKINKSAFYGCNQLTNLYLNEYSGICSLISSVFYSTPFSQSTHSGHIYVHPRWVEQYKNDTNWQSLANHIYGL